jgi:hypothetical protein
MTSIANNTTHTTTQDDEQHASRLPVDMLLNALLFHACIFPDLVDVVTPG